MTPKKTTAPKTQPEVEYIGQYEGHVVHGERNFGKFTPGQRVTPTGAKHREALLATNLFWEVDPKTGKAVPPKDAGAVETPVPPADAPGTPAPADEAGEKEA